MASGAPGKARDILEAVKAVALPSPRLVAKYHAGRREGDYGEYSLRGNLLAGQATRGWELGGISVRASDTRALRLGELLECTMEEGDGRGQSITHT